MLFVASNISAKMLEALRASVEPMDMAKVRLKVLLYGPSGAGKTVEALELARMVNSPGKRIMYMDTGEGWVSLRNHPQLMPNVDRFAFKGLSQIELMVDAISAGIEGYENYSTVIFDEFSTIAKKDIHTVVNATMKGQEFAAAEFKQFNIATRRMEQVAFKLLELKETHHLILLSHQRVDRDERTQIAVTGPSFMPKFAETVKENMHVVGRMTADVTNKTGAPVYKREIQVHPSRMVVAKSRIGGLEILNPVSQFNKVVSDWLVTGKEEEVRQPVELEDEQPVRGDFSDQTDFVGIEVKE